MVRRFGNLFTAYFIISLPFALVGCAPALVTVEPDTTDHIDYGFGGGEVGAD